MDIVLVHPPYKNVYARIRGIRYLDPPLGLLYVAAALRQDGHNVHVIDSEAEAESDVGSIVREIRALKPGLIGLTFTTPMLLTVVDMARAIKKELPLTPVVLGGPHVTAEPIATIEATGADYAVLGEGDLTVRELALRLSQKERISETKGLCFREGTRIVKPPPRHFVHDLDELPFPARDLLRIDRYKHTSSQSRRDTPYYTNLISTRGCPFKCIFCGGAAVFGETIRFREPSLVVDEIRECMTRFRIGIFGFADDTVTVRKNHIMGICEEIVRRNLNPLWSCQARVNTVDDEILRAMKRSGCEEIHFGYESGSQRVLDTIKKGITVEQSLMATKTARRSRMKIHGYFMIGNPGETEESIRQTIALARKLNPDTAQFTIAQPFPGTEFYRIAFKGDNRDKGFENFRWYEAVNYVPESLTKEKIVSLHRLAFRSFYFRPRYVLKVFASLRSPGNWGWILGGLKSFMNITRKRRAG